MRRRLLGVLVLAALAGCSGVLSDPAATNDTGAGPFTPAPVPDLGDAADEGPTGLAPGLDEGGVHDVDRLVRAHRSAVRGRSYAWRSNESTTGAGDADFGTSVRQQLVVETESRYAYRTNSRSVRTGDDWRFYADLREFAAGDSLYRRYELASGDGTPRYQRLTHESATDRWAGEAITPLQKYLPLRDATVAPRTVDGTRYFRLTGTRSSVSEYGQVRDFRARALIAPDGFVRSLTVTFRHSDGSVRRTVSFAYTDLGTATVDRPSWVEAQWDGAEAA